MSRIGGLAAALVLIASATAFAQPAGWSDWRHGGGGHGQAESAAERSGEPMVVYFHTDWCPWCQKLNERYLRTGPLRDVLGKMQKVELNPERDGAAKALFSRYGGGGYPAFYVLVPGSGERPVKLSPFSRSKTDQTPAEFAARIRDTATGQYNRWAQRLHRAGDTTGALEVTERSLAFNPRNAYAHYLQGLVHHQSGHERRDVAALHRAKAAYERALALDPGHGDSRKGLEALRNLQ